MLARLLTLTGSEFLMDQNYALPSTASLFLYFPNNTALKTKLETVIYLIHDSFGNSIVSAKLCWVVLLVYAEPRAVGSASRHGRGLGRERPHASH